jgi:hypothetical protein
MGDLVFLGYSQQELNRNFDQRAWASNALEVIARYPILSTKTRERLVHRAGFLLRRNRTILSLPVRDFCSGAYTLARWSANFCFFSTSRISSRLAPGNIFIISSVAMS